jgi:mannose-6-phosphate isomerase-like protein (cupin superfamily)
MIAKTNIHEGFQKINKYWNPRVIGELNGQAVKLARFYGPFHFHQHDHEDEMFMVIKGSFQMELPNQILQMEEGDMVVIPRGTPHRPVAHEEALVMLFEPVSTRKEGDQ